MIERHDELVMGADKTCISMGEGGGLLIVRMALFTWCKHVTSGSRNNNQVIFMFSQFCV